MIQVDVAILLNSAGPGGFAFSSDVLNFQDTNTLPAAVFADWGLSQTTVVPLPASGWLILSGLAGLFIAKRRRSKVAACDGSPIASDRSKAAHWELQVILKFCVAYRLHPR